MPCPYYQTSTGLDYCDALPEKLLTPALSLQETCCLREKAGYEACKIFKLFVVKDDVSLDTAAKDLKNALNLFRKNKS